MTSEWVDWHKGYEGDQPLTRRLKIVQDLIRRSLREAPPGPVRVVSLCAGDGRDLLGVLESDPRAKEVRARMVDMDPDLVRAGQERIAKLGLPGVELRRDDASVSDGLEGAVPADLVLACGIFGNVTDQDLERFVGLLPGLCAPRATVIWTRGRFPPDLTPSIRAWFRTAGFEEMAFLPVPDSDGSVGCHRLVAAPRRFRPGTRLFTFLPKGERPADRDSKAHSGLGGEDGRIGAVAPSLTKP